ncbi:MAG: galactokinase [Deltaproteobacteria bacterium]|nr:galactokinase [Deltaproteobacteria bacterium]
MGYTRDDLKRLFIERYGAAGDVHIFFAPGRINLIGEHIDYNDGLVLPGALSLGIYGCMRFRGDDLINLKSLNENRDVTINLKKDIVYNPDVRWVNYPAGVIKYLQDNHKQFRGFDILFAGDLPDGGGLSSSAAMEVLTAYMLLYAHDEKNIDLVWLAKLCQQVENEFVGVSCGIMDQFAVSLGRKDNAVLLNTATLEYEYIPFRLEHCRLIIMNTKKKRELAASSYNERRAQCEQALAIIQAQLPVKALVEAGLDDARQLIDNEVLFRRARHVITENQRVREAVEALKKADLETFGRLLNASHMSLRDDYEVTGFELDTMVESALAVEGCLGARMTGAGFGGCALALVHGERVQKFMRQVTQMYTDKTHIKPDLYVSTLHDGVGRVS